MVINLRYKSRIMSRKTDVHFGRVKKCEARLRPCSPPQKQEISCPLSSHALHPAIRFTVFICYRVIAEFLILSKWTRTSPTLHINTLLIFNEH